MIKQTLCNGCKSNVTKEYQLSDTEGVLISFVTAQEAFDWIAKHTPGAVTNVYILPVLTEGELDEEIDFISRNDISVFHSECRKCHKVFDDRYRMYYPCPEHPPI